MERCVVRYSLFVNGLLALIGAASGILLVAMAASTSDRFGWKDWSALAFFGSVAILFGSRVLNREPRLIVDESGITDGRGGVGFVPWEEVQKVVVKYMGRVDAVWVYPRSPDRWKSRLPLISRFHWRVFPKWHVVSINLQNMDVPTADIVAVLKDLAGQGKVEFADA